MWKNKHFLLLLVFLVFPFPSEGKIYLDVYGTGLKKITIAVPPFGGAMDRLRMDLPELLNRDLDLTGFFITAPFSLMDTEMVREGTQKSEIRFVKWRALNIELLCKGRFVEERDSIIVEAFLYDVAEETLILAKRYTAPKDMWREAMHRLSDDIVYTITGERGITNSKILFVAKEGNAKEIYISDIDGYNIRKLTSFGSITLSPSLSPDGNLLAYTSYKGKKPDLYVMDLKRKVEVYEDRSEGTKIPHFWLSKRTLVYSHSWGKHSAIYAFDLENKEKKELIRGTGIYTSASFSPDGKKMAFVSDMHGSPQIFLKNLDNGETKRVTFSGNYNSAPTFSPKGGFIAFVSKMEGNFEICLADENGSNMRILTDGGLNDSPQFSPCGRYIIYSSSKGKESRIYIMLVNGENRKMLRLTGGDETQPRFVFRREE